MVLEAYLALVYELLFISKVFEGPSYKAFVFICYFVLYAYGCTFLI